MAAHQPPAKGQHHGEQAGGAEVFPIRAAAEHGEQPGGARQQPQCGGAFLAFVHGQRVGADGGVVAAFGVATEPDVVALAAVFIDGVADGRGAGGAGVAVLRVPAPVALAVALGVAFHALADALVNVALKRGERLRLRAGETFHFKTGGVGGVVGDGVALGSRACGERSGGKPLAAQLFAAVGADGEVAAVAAAGGAPVGDGAVRRVRLPPAIHHAVFGVRLLPVKAEIRLPGGLIVHLKDEDGDVIPLAQRDARVLEHVVGREVAAGDVGEDAVIERLRRDAHGHDALKRGGRRVVGRTLRADFVDGAAVFARQRLLPRLKDDFRAAGAAFQFHGVSGVSDVGCPQAVQNLAPGASSAPHLLHAGVVRCPQALQNFAPAGSAAPQCAQGTGSAAP